ncbi:MAG: MTH938/NDUFAF3 family protein [Bacteroidota bacterium]|nr:MTH938/NDUFAF3 family protein [Bacteroidota bacterium]
MKIKNLSFGSIDINGETYTKDVIIDRGSVRKRKKTESKKYRESFGHTPLSVDENIPWNCRILIIGTGHSSSLPVMKEVYEEAVRKGVKILTMSTPEAIKHINEQDTNFILHLTC